MTAPLATPATTESSTLYFGPWYRRSPFFEKTLEAGCSAYDIYNHMYLPGYYGDPLEEYWALLNDVTVWDVSVERIVEISGPDASAFTNTLTWAVDVGGVWVFGRVGVWIGAAVPFIRGRRAHVAVCTEAVKV